MGGALSAPRRAPLFKRLASFLGLVLPSRSPKKLGRQGEKAAARYLEKAGYKILARNFGVRGGEADIIAEKEGIIHAVEVKSRSSRAFGSPEEAVTPLKARRLMRAAVSYCRSRNVSLSKLRLDVIAVEPDASGALAIRHHPNALSTASQSRRK